MSNEPIIRPKRPPMSTFEVMGWEARMEGQTRQDCPCLAGGYAARQWLRGWEAADKLLSTGPERGL